MNFVKALTNRKSKHEPKRPDALRCGILGAARIGPEAVINPAKSHPDFQVAAVAARSKAKADAYAKVHGIPKVYSGENGYQDLLNDQEIDVVYNPLPNGLHYEWTMKALKAGKHVLLEKPATDTEDEAKEIFDYAQKKGLVVLEAFHPRFHPAINRVKDILSGGELGKLKSVSASLCVPWQMQIAKPDDIRFDYNLGGGILMDMGCYTLNMIRFIAGAEPTSVVSANSQLVANPKNEEAKQRIDVGTTASLAFPDDVLGSINCHSQQSGWGPFGLFPRIPDLYVEAICDGGSIKIFNYVVPSVYHYITVSPKGGKKRTEKIYTFADGYGNASWSTYRYQLEAFVEKVRGREPKHWITSEDTIANMRWLEKIYEKTGLGSRPRSQFVITE